MISPNEHSDTAAAPAFDPTAAVAALPFPGPEAAGFCAAHHFFLDHPDMITGGAYLTAIDDWPYDIPPALARGVWDLLTPSQRRMVQWTMVLIITGGSTGTADLPSAPHPTPLPS